MLVKKDMLQEHPRVPSREHMWSNRTNNKVSMYVHDKQTKRGTHIRREKPDTSQSLTFFKHGKQDGHRSSSKATDFRGSARRFPAPSSTSHRRRSARLIDFIRYGLDQITGSSRTWTGGQFPFLSNLTKAETRLGSYICKTRYRWQSALTGSTRQYVDGKP